RPSSTEPGVYHLSIPMSLPDLAPYAGCWVALVAGQVAGVGQSAEAARLAAHHSRPRERIEAIFLVTIQTHDSSGYIESGSAER
ncbi:MAG: hypothetical protein ABTQ73_08295, partial [Caldilineales bacterium]